MAGVSCLLAGALGGAEAVQPVLELSDLDGSNGVALNGVLARDRSGHAVSGLGDVNGDGVDDLLIGAPGASTSYVVFGSSAIFTDGFESGGTAAWSRSSP